MKAAQISEYGAANVIHVVDTPKPEVSEGQVLVEVHAASLNPFDIKVREGVMKKMLHLPVTLGGDIAGIVAEVGADVTNLAVGDAVYGQALAVGGGSGAFAEYALTQASKLAKKPANLDFLQAAASPLVGVSAYQVITAQLKLQPGQKILIHGGAGGIGAVAIQLAKHIGAHVAATATGEGIDRVRKLGADEVIDYTSEQFEEKLHNFDAVFDTVGGETYKRSFKVLTEGGIIVSMLEAVDSTLIEQYSVRAIAQQTRINAGDLTALAKLVEAGVIVPPVDRVYPLADAAQAFAAWESGSVKGKVVLKIHED